MTPTPEMIALATESSAAVTFGGMALSIRPATGRQSSAGHQPALEVQNGYR